MILKHIAHIASCEWILTKFNRPNGGEVILIRTILVSIQIFVLAIGLVITLDPDVTLSNILHQLHKYIPWLGAITAGVYTALYARFSSQWTYLAGVYNQIKSAEATSSDTKPSSATDAIYAWKAGFIEDAEELHLATKPLFAEEWGQVSHGSNHGNAVGSIFQFIAVVKASRLRVSY